MMSFTVDSMKEVNKFKILAPIFPVILISILPALTSILLAVNYILPFVKTGFNSTSTAMLETLTVI
jgi:hypothetical protein